VIVALMCCEVDLDRTMSLARLLADVEPAPRTDVHLALVCQPGTPRTSLVDRTVRHCARRFDVDVVTSPLGAPGYPEGCTALWTGTMRYYSGSRECRGSHTSVLTLDGGDGVPLHRNWLDLMLGEHRRTLALGKLITGSPYYLGGCPLHVNPNAVFELSVLGRTKLATDVPRSDGTLLTNFDVYHRKEMLANASLSSVVRTDWRGAGNEVSVELMRRYAASAVWLHGYKDEDLYWVARRHLFGGDVPEPRLERYDLQDLYLQESFRRRRT
jgi:hypothetical protein